MHVMISRKQAHRRTGRSCRGFTLIEITLVLLLMALLVSITAVMFANALPRARMTSAAGELTAAVKYARNLARATHEPQTVAIDLTARTYSVSGRRPKVLAGDAALTIYERPEAQPATDGKYTIVYDATLGSNWSSMILSRGGRKITVKADPVLTAVTLPGKADENARR
ncbi:MAG: prepilin-type N-terminal cleavage/methylation domain-containing protein [Deltaproteobacteria bacterium]|nr:prepilin-type N-terminal cleavage/methylation domain-containing protein [Deltaproteobacteria bacterium]